MEKKRRWEFSQMGVSCVHRNLNELFDELKQIEKNGLEGDAFELKIIDMADEDFDKLEEFEGFPAKERGLNRVTNAMPSSGNAATIQ